MTRPPIRSKVPTFLALAFALVAIAFSTPPAAAQNGTYRVEITNLSHQIISPPIVVSHSWRTRIFASGTPASPEIAALAEDAVADGLLAALGADPEVFDFAIADAPLMPGASTTLELDFRPHFDRLSAVGMLVTTNDAFFGVTNFLVGRGVQRTTAPAYDAGSEANNELCAFIPGPPCGNPGVRATAGAEGVITVHNGIHDVGDLASSEWDWRNPVVRLTIVGR